MTDPAAEAARAAAAILAPDLGPNLQAEVEAALAARNAQQRPDRYLDPVSLASLIVSIATLAWTIYNDQRTRTPDPPPASSPARSASSSATRTPLCPMASSASPKWSPPRSPATPGRQSSHAVNAASRQAGHGLGESQGLMFRPAGSLPWRWPCPSPPRRCPPLCGMSTTLRSAPGRRPER